MKRKIRRMRQLVAIAAADEKRASTSMARMLSRHDHAVKRLNELEQYRQDYASSGARGRPDAFRLLDYHRFLDRLGVAITSQQQLVAEADLDVEAHRERWLEKRQRLQSLQSALDRFCDDDRRAEDRLEQKRQDELSSRTVSPITRGH